KLLVIECNRRATAGEPMLLAKICYRFFRIAKLPTQVDNAVVQPTGGPLSRFKTRVELVDHIGISYRVSEFGSSHWIVPSNRNVEDLSLPATRNFQRSPQAINAIANQLLLR